MRPLSYIVTVLFVTGAILHFTLPVYESVGPGSCVTGERPLADLAAVRLYGAYPGEPITLWQEHVATAAGVADSFAVAWDGARPLSLWVAAADTAGNEGCWTACQLGGSVAVDPVPAGPGLRWYDVAGRRVGGKPTTPGVYFYRGPLGRGQIVILR